MVIYSETICNSVLYFLKSLVNVLLYFHNLKNKKEEIHFLFGVKTTRDFPGGAVVKKSAYQSRTCKRHDSIPG